MGADTGSLLGRRLPWWLGCGLGLVAGALGIYLILNPLASLASLSLAVGAGLVLTGAGDLTEHRGQQTDPAHDPGSVERRPGGEAAGRSRAVVASMWIGVGVLVLVWPDISTQTLAVVVGASLIVGGLVEVVHGVRGTAGRGGPAVVSGVASVVFGVLALTWPDVTLLVVSIVFGIRLLTFGLRVAWSSIGALRRSSGPGEQGPVEEGPAVQRGRLALMVGPVATLVFALLLAGLSVQVNRAEGVIDDFYDPPDDVPDEAGVLLRSERFERAMPEGAIAWRILYTTTLGDGRPAVASGIVAVPERAVERSSESDGVAVPLPVIAWAHGTTGVARHCAPSVLPDPWGAGSFALLDHVIDEGWAVVATDYPGMGAPGAHPYLVGEPAGRSVLDAVRAARHLEDVDLADETVVWGHSQGGGSALWTGILAPSYAPDVELVGVAALAPASDLVGLMEVFTTVTGGSIFAGYGLWGYSSYYPDVKVSDYVRPAARTTYEQAASRCLDGTALASILSSVAVGMDVFIADFASGPLMDRLAENVPDDRIEAPLLIAQGEADGLVLPSVQGNYVASRCAAGQPIDYRTYPGRGHVPLVQADSPLVPELVEWTRDRFVGEAAASNC